MAAWRETPMRRYARCPVHGDLAVMKLVHRKGRPLWQWSWGCQTCLAEADEAAEVIHVPAVDDGDNAA